MSGMDPAAFLTARLDEDEARVRNDIQWWWDARERIEVYTALGMLTGGEQYIEPFIDPARMLREVAAKRAILMDYQVIAANAAIEKATQPDEVRDAAHELVIKTLRMVLQRMATAYADHSDYQEGWKPWAISPLS